jgi:hypothetical protein
LEESDDETHTLEMMHPQLLEGLKEESHVEDNGKEKESRHAP